MNVNMPDDPQFNQYYQKHLKYLKLKGLRPKTIEAYSRSIRRIGNYFYCRIDNLTRAEKFLESSQASSFHLPKQEKRAEKCTPG